MIGCRVGFLFALSLTACAGSGPFAQAPDVTPPGAGSSQADVEPLRQRASRYRRVLKAATPEDMLRLKHGEDISLGLMAAWRELRLSVDDDVSAELVPEDLQHFERFVGFIEGRTQSRVDDKWAASFADAVFWLKPHYQSLNIQKEEVWVKQLTIANADAITVQQDPPGTMHVESGKTIEAPAGTDIIETGRTVTVRVGENMVMLDRTKVDAFVETTGHSRIRLRMWIVRHRAYVLLFNYDGDPCPLFCVDVASGKTLWMQTIWALGDFSMLIGLRGLTDVAMRNDNESVTLYGWGTSHFIERFSSVTGEPQFRFATNGWGATWQVDP